MEAAYTIDLQVLGHGPMVECQIVGRSLYQCEVSLLFHGCTIIARCQKQ